MVDTRIEVGAMAGVAINPNVGGQANAPLGVEASVSVLGPLSIEGGLAHVFVHDDATRAGNLGWKLGLKVGSMVIGNGEKGFSLVGSIGYKGMLLRRQETIRANDMGFNSVNAEIDDISVDYSTIRHGAYVSGMISMSLGKNFAIGIGPEMAIYSHLIPEMGAKAMLGYRF